MLDEACFQFITHYSMKHYSLFHIYVKDNVFSRQEAECGEGVYQKELIQNMLTDYDP